MEALSGVGAKAHFSGRRRRYALSLCCASAAAAAERARPHVVEAEAGEGGHELGGHAGHAAVGPAHAAENGRVAAGLAQALGQAAY